MEPRGQRPIADENPDLQRRQAILQVLGRAAQQLLTATGSGLDEAVNRLLAELGTAAGAGRAYIYANSTAEDGRLCARQAYLWHAAGAPPLRPSPVVREQSYEARGLGRWVALLSAGEAIHGAVSALPQPERSGFQATGIRAIAVVPIFVDGRWWGFIGFSDFGQGRRWRPSELDALRVAAGTIGAAFQRRAAEQQIRQRNRELDLLNRVIAATTSTLDPVQVLETTCRELARAFAIPQAGAALLNPAGTALDIVAQYSELDVIDPVGSQIPLAENEASRYVLERKEPLYIADVRHDRRMATVRELMAQRQVGSILLVPLLAGEEAVGTIGLDAPAVNAFTPEDIALAASAAAAAGQALSRAHLLTAETRNTRRLAGILRLSTELATLRAEEALRHRLVQGLAEVAGSATCSLFLAEEQGEHAQMVAQVGLPAGSEGLRVSLTLDYLEEVAARGEPFLVADIDRTFPALRRYLLRPDVHAFQLYPLSSEGEILGFITLSYAYPYEPSAAEVSAFRLLAERAAAAIHSVRLLQAVRQQAEHLGALHELGLAISSTLEPQQVYEAIVEQGALLLDVGVANLFLWDEEQSTFLGLASRAGSPESVRGERYPLHSSQLVPSLLEREGALAIADAAASPLVDARWRQRFRLGALLAVPLRYRERLVGFFIGGHTDGPRTWTPAEIRLAESLAAPAAIAVANARLHAATRRLLAQTRAQARTVQQILDTVPEGLLVLSRERRLLLANPPARDYLALLAAYSADGRLRTLGGQPLPALLLPPPGNLPHEVQVQEPHHRTFEVSAHRLDAGPQAGNWMLVIHEATAEREQQAYLQAQDRLATVGQLAAGIAHDFNNIMAVISLYAESLLQQAPDPAEREGLSVIYRQAHQASHLIGQILDFSRRSVVERGPLNLVPFLKELVKLLERTLPETIAVSLDYGSGDYVVYADPTRLQQALINLALNARDAMPGGGTLRFALARHGAEHRPLLPDMEAGEWIKLTVADSGKGIAREALPHIFEPFYTTKEPGEGTGLGLAQVYGIVKQHDGFVDLRSEPGAGAVFSLYLPALAVSRAAGEGEVVARTAGASGETILLVEDNPAMRAALAQTLADLGYHLLLAADGEEALALLAREPARVELVLSDLVMPRLGGQALCAALRRQAPHLSVILFSGYPLGESTRHFVEQSGCRWLQKPFSANTLHEAVQAALQEARDKAAEQRPES